MPPGSESLSPQSLAVGLCLGMLLLILPRRFALGPLMAAACYMTFGQALMIGPLHVYLIRLVILFGIVRIVIRKELFAIVPSRLDGLLVSWLFVSALLYVLVNGEYVSPVERFGYVYDSLGLYAIVRALISDFGDIVAALKLFALIIVPLSGFFIAEAITGKNLFSAMGGVPLVSVIRNGRVRCQGPFKHSILAGTFGATSLPLFVGLWLSGKGARGLATLAIAASTIIVMCSASSGPFTAFLIGLVGCLFWVCRAYTRLIRWSVLAGFIALAAVMKAPVWFIIDRLSDLLGSGDGWYRSALIDAAIRHFNEWWLVGTGYTAHWMPTGIRGNPFSADIVNEFVNQAIRGGLLAVILFVWLLSMCFAAAGTFVRNDHHSRGDRMVAWSIGCAMLAHVASFFSVAYFDQIIIVWYLTIGMLAVLINEPATTRLSQTADAAETGVRSKYQARSVFGHAVRTRNSQGSLVARQRQ